MFQQLDAYLRNFSEHEQYRYNLLNTMTGEEQEQAFQNDRCFIWSDREAIGDSDAGGRAIQPRQHLTLTRNKRFIRGMKHRHVYIEMQYAYSGVLRNIIGGHEVQVHTGEILLMDSSVDHELLPAGENDIGINIIMHREFFNSGFQNILAQNDFIARLVVDSLYAKKEEKKYILFDCGQNKRIQMCMRMMLEEWRLKESGHETALQGYLLVLFTELMRDYQEKNAAPNSDMKQPFMEDLSNYLSQNYATADLKSTAAHFNFNQDYLSRMIKKQLGISFVTLLRDIKMQQGCIMLTNTDLSVDEIASLLGYGDTSYFYRAFRNAYHKTPSEFRKVNRTKN